MTKLTDVETNHMCITPNQTTTWKVSIQGGNAARKLQHKVHAHATQHNNRAMQGVLPVPWRCYSPYWQHHTEAQATASLEVITWWNML